MKRPTVKPLRCPTCGGFGAHDGGKGYGTACKSCNGSGRVTGNELAAIRQAQTCPACGSQRTLWPTGTGEACACADCAQLFVPEHRPDPDAQLCNDCAFRPGSPERADPYKWAEIIQTTIVDQVHPFHCHKGLACRLDGQTLTYLQPAEGEQAMQPCAGWRAHLAAYKAGTPARKL